MKRGKIFILGILLLANFLLLDFPGAKIVLAIVILTVLINFQYTRSVRKKFQIKRFMDTQKIFSGLSEDTSLVLTNTMSLPIHALLIEDNTDLNISIEQTHHFIFSLNSQETELVTYKIFGRKRGKFQIGPTRVRFTDIMGLYSFNIEANTYKNVVVFPNILLITDMHYKSIQPYGVIKNKMPIFEDTTMMQGLKEYQQGDEIKRINWKVSARFDKLFVNTYQPSISAGSLIILNLYVEDYQFRNRDLYIEQSIELAASLIRELFLKRQEVGLASNCQIDKTDTILRSDITKGEAHYTSLLTNLAVIDFSKHIRLNELLDPSRLKLPWGICLYVITPWMSEDSIFKLIDLHNAGHSVTVVNVGPEIQHRLSLWSVGFQSFFAEREGNLINFIEI